MGPGKELGAPQNKAKLEKRGSRPQKKVFAPKKKKTLGKTNPEKKHAKPFLHLKKKKEFKLVVRKKKKKIKKGPAAGGRS